MGSTLATLGTLGGSTRDVGQCPSCRAEGRIGASCEERICALRGYGFVPREVLSDGELDPMIGQRCGDYLLIGVLGSGGFGRVYRAVQLPVGMPAAVKLLDLDNGPAGLAAVKLEKFDIEAQALARLSHPNVVRLYQYGQHRGVPYLAMELVEDARNLWSEIEARAAEGRPFELDEVETILSQTLAALEAAHERQIVHRDIKPENIMLHRVPGHGLFVKVLDFGLAKFSEDQRMTSMLLGTPAYMAYEQLVRTPLGPWTDLYALGVLAFELFTGVRPYGGGGVQEVLALKLDHGFDPWSRVAEQGLPHELRVFVAHALARETEARYASAPQMREALAHVVAALREAGPPFTRISAERLADPTLLPVAPVATTSLPDPTRRLARPPPEPAPAAPDAAPAPAAASPVVPPRSAGTAPTTAVTPPPPSRRMTRVVNRRALRGWLFALVLVLAGGALAAWFVMRADRADHSDGALEVPTERVAMPPAPATTPPSAPATTPPSAPATTPSAPATTPPAPATTPPAPATTPPAPATAPPTPVTSPATGLEGAVQAQAGSDVQRDDRALGQRVDIPAGTFARGSAPHDPYHRDDEDLQEVVLTRPLVAMATEVTQAQWSRVFGTRPWRHVDCGASCPVEGVSWWDAIGYANALSEREGRDRCYVVRGCRGLPGDGDYSCRDVRFVGLDCDGWRLPTEAEWEYLALARTPPRDLALAAVNGLDAPLEVGSRAPDAFGLDDMIGNVREWVLDGYGDYPARNRVRDPIGVGDERVLRGGGFRSARDALRAAAREHAPPDTRADDLGFRLVRSATD